MGCWYLVETIECILQLFSIHASNHTGFVFTGYFDNPGPLGGFLAVIGTIAVTYILVNRDTCGNLAKFFCGVIVALLVILLPASMSRAAWLSCGVPVLLCVCLEFDVWSYVKRHKSVSIISLIVVLLLAIGAFYLKKDSAIGRFHIWKIELLAIMEEPVSGHGPGTELGAYGDTQAEYFRLGKGGENEIAVAGCPEYAFNELLKIGLERGIFVMLAVFAFMIFILLRLMNVNRPFSFGFLALCIFSLFSYPFSLWQFRVLLTIFLAIALVNNSQEKIVIIADKIATIAMVIATMCFSGAYLDAQKSKKDARKEWQSLRALSSFDMYEDIVEGLEPLLPILKDNYRYLYDYGYALHKCEKYIESNEILRKGTKISSDPMFHNIIGKNYEGLGLYTLAQEQYEYSHYMVPCRLYPLVLLEELFLKQGNQKEAKQVLDKINSMPVNERHMTMINLKRRANDNYYKGGQLCE